MNHYDNHFLKRRETLPEAILLTSLIARSDLHDPHFSVSEVFVYVLNHSVKDLHSVNAF